MKLKFYLTCFLIGMILITGCGKKEKAEQEVIATIDLYDSESVRTKYGIWINESTLCEDVVNHKPINPANEFHTENSIKIFLFTRIGCDKPGWTIYHRFSVFKESLKQNEELWEEVHITDLQVRLTNYRTWSYKTVYPGKWRADILAPDKKSIIKAYFFNVTGPKKETSSLNYNPDYDMNQLKLIDAELCKGIENNQPVDPSEEFILEGDEQYKKVWAWMKFQCENTPVKVFLHWSRWIESVTGERNWGSEIMYSLEIKGKIWRTTGNKTCKQGKWRLDILGPDRKTILKTFQFQVKSAEKSDSVG